MEAARAAQGGRRKNLSLRPGSRARRQKKTFDAAFEGFYREHVAEVYHYALAVLGNSPDAEDVTQQALLNAYRAFQRGERPRNAHNWLIKIAHNVCRMRWRQSGRRPQEVPLEHAGEPAATDEERPSLDEVLAALAQLPFNQRAAIVMREIEDRSYAEIAEVLGTTVPAVEALLFRARGNLRERRKALAGAFTIVPVPGSVASFIGGGGGGAGAAGGTLVGSQLAVKAVAFVATGAVAGGLGFKAVDAVSTPESQAVRAPLVREQAPPVAALSLRSPGSGKGTHPVKVAGLRHPRGAVSGERALRGGPTDDGPPQSSSPGSGPAPSASAPDESAVTTTLSSTTNSIKQVLPPVPAAPTVPATPVTVSTPVTSVTVTVPTVTLPPPPPLK
jgi:RNA polymerase sigma factor (sigma-70 family)